MKKINLNTKLLSIFIVSSILPFLLATGNIYFGRIAFWYDPARDFLLAIQNIKNPTLIGQPSGLPGLFYGPYWIWTISVWTLLSKDPKVISFMLLTVPYFTFFPYILYKISKKWGIFIFISIWILFILNFGSYANQIWNVHYGAIFLLLTFYYLINPSDRKYRKNIDSVLLGVSAGLVANFHLSFGIPLLVGTLISVILIYLLENKKNSIKQILTLIKKVLLYSLGAFISFLPFLLFELRHSFIQLKTFSTAVTDSIVYNTATVGQTGMTDDDIIKSFFSKFTDFLGIPFEYINYLLIFIFFAAILMPLIKKTNLIRFEKRLIVGIFVISVIMLSSFIFNENPTWGYYFIGTEIFFMLFAGLLLSKLHLGKYLIIICLVMTLFNHSDDIKNIFKKNNFSNSDLGTRSYIVERIFKDADRDFQYYAYSSAIYTYEYDYLFMFYDGKNEKNINPSSSLVYIIVPRVTEAVKKDFINYRAPIKDYKQVSEWNIPDGTSVHKMIKK